MANPFHTPLLLLFLPMFAMAYIENWIEAPSYLNTSGAGKSTARERLSIHQNPAALFSSQYGISLHTYSPFGLEDIQISHGGFYWDWTKFGLSASWMHTNISSLYRENVFQFQSSWNVHPKWNVGMALSQEHLELASLGKSFGSTLSAGVLWYPHAQITLGAYGKNLWSRGFLASESSPSFHWGATLRNPSHRISVFLDFTHTNHYTSHAPSVWEPWKYHIGKQVQLLSSLWLYGGFQNRPYQLSFGIRLRWKDWAIQHSTSFQRLLGKTFHQGILFTGRRE